MFGEGLSLSRHVIFCPWKYPTHDACGWLTWRRWSMCWSVAKTRCCRLMSRYWVFSVMGVWCDLGLLAMSPTGDSLWDLRITCEVLKVMVSNLSFRSSGCAARVYLEKNVWSVSAVFCEPPLGSLICCASIHPLSFSRCYPVSGSSFVKLKCA